MNDLYWEGICKRLLTQGYEAGYKAALSQLHAEIKRLSVKFNIIELGMEFGNLAMLDVKKAIEELGNAK